MKLTRTHLVTALTTIAIAAPVSTAAAATAAPAVTRPAATVVGPRYITTAPTSFTNLNNQTSPGSTSLGNQTAG